MYFAKIKLKVKVRENPFSETVISKLFELYSYFIFC